MTRRQVFGLTGGGLISRNADRRSFVPCLLASLPSSREPVLMTRSFPITAAGQSRTFHRVPSCDAWNTGEPTQCGAL